MEEAAGGGGLALVGTQVSLGLKVQSVRSIGTQVILGLVGTQVSLGLGHVADSWGSSNGGPPNERLQGQGGPW